MRLARSFLPALALVALTLAPARAGVDVEPLDGGARFRVTFRHQPVIAAKSVAVAGSWNGWSATAQPLEDKGGSGTFTRTVELPRGKHYYKFVLNGSVWQHDGDNPAKDADGHSGFNSVLDLGAKKPAGAGTPGDGKVDLDELLHDPADLSYASAVDGGKRLVLRVHLLARDVERVRFVVSPRALQGEAVEARRIATIDGRDVWEARPAWAKNPGRVRYQVEALDGAATARHPAGRERVAVVVKDLERLVTPDWVRDAIFYQVFPDRFRDGDPTNQPKREPRPAGKPWHVDDRYLEAWDAEPAHFNFMGGDLAGITEKADYLRDLGVNALYLNPIFAAESNHRYDAADYEKIDPALGTLADYHRMRDALKARGMRIVLDCVFNHTGDAHYAFRDAMEKGPSSKFWSWYFFDGGFPVLQTPKPNYRCWWGFGSLPQLDTKNPKVVEHLMGVGKKWLAEGAHGWRLDVPNEVDEVNPAFWPEFRRRIKKQDPDAYIVGEIWTDARQWLQGDKFDAVMNYPVRSAILELASKDDGLTAAGFFEALGHQLATYPEAALRVQFNLLGSHDTPRVRTLCQGDVRRVRLANALLFAYPGAPVIYYGDEIGLEGGKDPECRRTYPWDQPHKQDQALLEHTRALTRLRAAEPALRRGVIRFLHTQGRAGAFAREPEPGDPGRTVVCAFNAGQADITLRVPLAELEGTPTALLGGRDVRRDGDALVVTLGPLEAAYVALEAVQKK